MRNFWRLSRLARAIRGYSLALLGLLLQVSPVLAQQSESQADPFHERVRAERVVVNARVTDNFGNPIPGLSAKDFRLRVDGGDVPLESVEWMPSGEAEREDAAPVPERGAVAPHALSSQGRLILMLFQWEVFADEEIVPGYVRMLHHARRMLDSLGPSDNVAVANFVGQLWVQQDFTADRAKVHDALRHIFRRRSLSEAASDGSFSLLAGLNEQDGRRATSIEKALATIGRALAPISGPKSLLLFGWGMGRMAKICSRSGCEVSRTFVSRDYEPARLALVASDTAVFSLDVTNVDHNPLRHGLERIAYDTGGFYMQTHIFPRLALQKVQRTLNGHYVLVFRKPDGPPGAHAIRIDLVGRRGTVLHRRSYEDGKSM